MSASVVQRSQPGSGRPARRRAASESRRHGRPPRNDPETPSPAAPAPRPANRLSVRFVHAPACKTELITVIHRERPPATTQSARRGLRFGSVRRPSVHAPPCPRRARRDSGRPAIAADPAGDRCDNRGGCHRLTGDAVPATRPGCLLDVLEDPLHRLQLPRMTTVWVKVSAGGSRCLLGAHRASGRKGSSGWAGARARRSPAGIT
jgi:hypothetical protein